MDPVVAAAIWLVIGCILGLVVAAVYHSDENKTISASRGLFNLEVVGDQWRITLGKESWLTEPHGGNTWLNTLLEHRGQVVTLVWDQSVCGGYRHIQVILDAWDPDDTLEMPSVVTK